MSWMQRQTLKGRLLHHVHGSQVHGSWRGTLFSYGETCPAPPTLQNTLEGSRPQSLGTAAAPVLSFGAGENGPVAMHTLPVSTWRRKTLDPYKQTTVSSLSSVELQGPVTQQLTFLFMSSRKLFSMASSLSSRASENGLLWCLKAVLEQVLPQALDPGTDRGGNASPRGTRLGASSLRVTSWRKALLLAKPSQGLPVVSSPAALALPQETFSTTRFHSGS